MRVLTVLHSLEAGGGIETFLVHFFRSLDRKDIELELCYTGGKPGSLQADAEACGVKFWRCDWRMNQFSFMRDLTREIRQRGPYDVVHAHIHNFSGPILTAARRCGVPIRIAHYHNAKMLKRDPLRLMYQRWVRSYALRDATAILGCSWEALRGYYPEHWDRDPRMAVLRYGIPLDKFVGVDARDEVRAEFKIPADATLFGHVGRLSKQKNHPRLVEAARMVVDRMPGARFMFVGGGELRGEVEAQIASLGLQDHIVLTGLRKDVPRLLSAMDVFTLPSLFEGYGMVLIEAQVMGLPIVSTNVPTAYEAVAPIFHEYFMDPADSRGLADALIAVAERAQREPRLREEAEKFGRAFAIENAREAMLAAWGYPGAKAPADVTGLTPAKIKARYAGR